MKKSILFLTVILIISTVLSFSSCGGRNFTVPNGWSPESPASVGDAPQFELYDQYGNLIRRTDLLGKVVFLNIWATWCPPCRAEMPDIQALYEKYGDGGEVVILGLAFPGVGGEEDVAGITSFLEENGYTYPVLMADDASLLNELYVNAYPTTFMIDRSGNIFGSVVGAMDRSRMQEIIDQTLAQDE